MAKRKCNNCGEVLESTSAFCPKCGKKPKKSNMFLFFLLMLVVFFVIAEILLIIFMLIVLVIFGNSYVFREKKVGFFKGLIIGLPMVLFSLYLLSDSALYAIHGLNIANLINLVALCAGVGIAEEFLCRAWLQNEFIERFGSTNKGVIMSIFLSSIVFGAMHITNGLFTSQTMFETLMQIMQAVGSGMLLGAIYYKTKNIWVNSFIHGFFDFAIMLAEVNLIKDCTNVYTTLEQGISGILSTIIIIGFYVGCAFFALSSKEGQTFYKKDQLKKKRTISIIVCIVSLILLPISGFFFKEDVGVCYTYKDEIINDVFDIGITNRKSYDIDVNDHHVKFFRNGKNMDLVIDDDAIILDYDDNIEDWILVSNDNVIEILIHYSLYQSDIYYLRIDLDNYEKDKSRIYQVRWKRKHLCLHGK